MKERNVRETLKKVGKVAWKAALTLEVIREILNPQPVLADNPTPEPTPFCFFIGQGTQQSADAFLAQQKPIYRNGKHAVALTSKDSEYQGKMAIPGYFCARGDEKTGDQNIARNNAVPPQTPVPESTPMPGQNGQGAGELGAQPTATIIPGKATEGNSIGIGASENLISNGGPENHEEGEGIYWITGKLGQFGNIVIGRTGGLVNETAKGTWGVVSTHVVETLVLAASIAGAGAMLYGLRKWNQADEKEANAKATLQDAETIKQEGEATHALGIAAIDTAINVTNTAKNGAAVLDKGAAALAVSGRQTAQQLAAAMYDSGARTGVAVRSAQSAAAQTTSEMDAALEKLRQARQQATRKP